MTAPAAFLASRMLPLLDARKAIFDRGQNEGVPVWVSEHSGASTAQQDPQAIRLRCLKAVRDCPIFICVLDGTYGSPLDQSDVSILELEIFMAALAGKPIRMIQIDRAPSDPRLTSLIAGIRAASVQPITMERSSRADLPSVVAAIAANAANAANASPTTTRLNFGGFLQWLARARFVLRLIRSSSDIQFLNGVQAPIAPYPSDESLIRGLIGEARASTAIPDAIAALWTAFRHLSTMPNDGAGRGDQLALRRAFFGEWARCAAWYGLHGHLYLGRLAAVNSARLLAAPRSEDETIQSSSGAMASEYYSIAKQIPSRTLRFALRVRALQLLNEALVRGEPEPSGLLAIRGSVKFSIGRPFSAIDDYKAVVALRSRGGFSIGEVGEAESELGFGYHLMRRNSRAEPLLVSGVEKLRLDDRPEFTVRALRKLARFYRGSGRHDEARRSFHEALTLARTRELNGQLSQLLPECELYGVDADSAEARDA
jgi:hypothetical protein